MPTTQAATKAWIFGAILGVLILVALWGVGDYSFLAGLFLGLIGAIVLALFLVWLAGGTDGADAAEWEPEVLTDPAPISAQSLADLQPEAEAQAEAAKPNAAEADQDERQSADDLKLIKGVGPKLEELLHENGVTRFAQIADWDEEQIEHYAEQLGRMGGRIRSDDWVAQAKTLAEGGETEFSARVEKGEVY